MALSEKTIYNLAKALKSEVLEYIYEDDRYVEVMNEMISDAIQEKLGQVDSIIEAQISFSIFSMITLE